MVRRVEMMLASFFTLLLASNVILLARQQHIEEVLEHEHGMKYENFGSGIIWQKMANPSQRLSSFLKAASGGAKLGNISSDRPGGGHNELNTTEKQGAAKPTPACDQDNNITTHMLKTQVADLQRELKQYQRARQMELDLYQDAAAARTPAANTSSSSKRAAYIPSETRGGLAAQSDSAATVSTGFGGGGAGGGSGRYS